MYQSEGGSRAAAEAMLIGGVLVQYVASRMALTAGARPDAPGRRALAQWMPIAATALAALAMRQTAVAVALVFGSSVACLSLVPGLSGYVMPMQQLPPSRRLWVLILPVAVLLLLAGFHGSLTWYHAVMLLVMGAAFLGVWREPREGNGGITTSETASRAPPAVWAYLIPALALAAVGAWLAVRGTVQTGETSRMLRSEFLATTVLSPLLLLPALGAGTMAAQRGQMGELTTALCGTVLLNLCLLLPTIILFNYLVGGLAHLHTARGLHDAFATGAAATPFPLITWRLDSVLLVVLGFGLVPVATGRWMPERIEAILLVALYVAYLAAETVFDAGLLR